MFGKKKSPNILTDKLLALPNLSSSDSKAYQLSESGFTFQVYSSINDLPLDWEKAQHPKNIYLQRPILKAIEEAPPKGIKCCYLIFYRNGAPIGIAYCQILNFKTNENVQDLEGKGALKAFTSSVKSFLAKQFEFNLLVCGNLLFTGDHGHYFNETITPPAQAAKILDEALDKTQLFWKERKIKTDGIFIKDIDEERSVCRQNLISDKYREFLFHPNMVLPLRTNWNSMNDYLMDISSKYRVRAKKAFKCGQPIEKKELSLEYLQANKDHLYELYKGVMVTAGFNMVTLHENYIVKLKEYLVDDLTVTGYFLNGEMIGYRTNIKNYHELEAHFLGYDQSYNKECQLYMNMLLDSLQQGIEEKVERVVYARTAMEIKSTIGAIPEDLFCYIRANNKFMNSIMPPILEYFRPDDDWIQRNPFKEVGE
ncbi:MAG: hypothetical protein R2825_15000 [Saprospiraceae bacterium]